MFAAYPNLAGADERLKTALRATFCIFLQFTELIDDVFDLDSYSDFEFFCIRDR